MTITTESNKVQYTGNGVTTSFSFPYKFFTDSDIIVTNVLAGVTTIKTLGVDYNISGTPVGGPYPDGIGANVVFMVAPASGEQITIYRNLLYKQETDYVENDPFPANSHETALDRLTILCQQLKEALTRSVLLPVTTTITNLFIPTPEANKYLGWNSAGTNLENKETVVATITLPSFLEKSLNYIRINAAENNFEYRTNAQVRQDNTLINAGNPNGVVTGNFEGELLYDNTNDVIWQYAGSSTNWYLVGKKETITTKTANYTATLYDQTILCDATSGNFTITLPTAVGNTGLVYTIIKTDSSANTVTIDGNSSETINGALTVALAAQFDRLTIVSNGSNWLIESGLNTAEVFLTGGNGHGSTNTKIRRFVTTVRNIGSAITYADSATLGATFTINENGIYAITYEDYQLGAGAINAGISLNSAQLTTNVSTITNADRLGYAYRNAIDSTVGTSISRRLNVGDVIRAHTNGDPNGTLDAAVRFRITKIGV